MMRKVAISAALVLVTAMPAAAQDSEASARLSRSINQAMEAEGPWLLPAERALIARKCGYTPAEADSDNVSMMHGVLICSNGRRVDDPEVRAMMEIAGERISRRVNAVMSRPAIREAIRAVSDEAVREAMARLGEERPRRRNRR